MNSFLRLESLSCERKYIDSTSSFLPWHSANLYTLMPIGRCTQSIRWHVYQLYIYIYEDTHQHSEPRNCSARSRSRSWKVDRRCCFLRLVRPFSSIYIRDGIRMAERGRDVHCPRYGVACPAPALPPEKDRKQSEKKRKNTSLTVNSHRLPGGVVIEMSQTRGAKEQWVLASKGWYILGRSKY